MKKDESFKSPRGTKIKAGAENHFLGISGDNGVIPMDTESCDGTVAVDGKKKIVDVNKINLKIQGSGNLRNQISNLWSIKRLMLALSEGTKT